MRWSIAARNAASVFPDPVGARTRTLSPAAIAGHASSCALVGVWNVASNQARVAGLNVASGSLPTRRCYEPPTSSASLSGQQKGPARAGPFLHGLRDHILWIWILPPSRTLSPES